MLDSSRKVFDLIQKEEDRQFNLTQINVFSFFEEGNKISLISFILSMCALILILLVSVSKKIRDKNK